MLKLFRRLEHGENPDVEIGTLSHHAHAFRHTPSVLGVIRYCDAEGASYVTGMLSRFVAGARRWLGDRPRCGAGGVGAPGEPKRRRLRARGRAHWRHHPRPARRTRLGARHAGLPYRPRLVRRRRSTGPRRRAAPLTAPSTLLGERVAALPTPHQAMARAIAGRRDATPERLGEIAAQRSRLDRILRRRDRCARSGTMETIIWVSCCAAKRASGSLSTSRASHCVR